MQGATATNTVSRLDLVVGGLALALVVDLVFVPWFVISLQLFTIRRTAIADPHALLGALAVLTGLTLIGELTIERFRPRTALLATVRDNALTRLVLAVLAAALLVWKFALDDRLLARVPEHGAMFGIGFWLAIPLTIALVGMAFAARGTHGQTA